MSSYLFEVLEVFLSNAANVVNVHAGNWLLTLASSIDDCRWGSCQL